MRVNIGREGNASSSLSANGGAMLGPLILANGPSQPLEAATKYYVDTVFANLNANNVLGGILPISALPGFTGDATSNQGSNSFTLANLGVTPGSYAKVIVDAKGRVTGNDILLGSDIPNFNWDKVTGEPNTLSGYGITDALSTAGGTLTGNLSVPTPTQPMSIVNKQYTDSALSNNSTVVGDIIRKPYAITPVDFLRCNGGLVDKATYSDLYAVIGDNFANNSVKGSGKPWTQQYQINTTQSADITGWTTGTALPGILALSQVIVTKNRVYLLGGSTANNSANYINTVYTAPINTDGTLGAWTTGTSLPGGLAGSQAIVTKNRLYLLGGTDSSGTVSTVYTAPINSDGTLGTWTTGTSLPGAIIYSQAIVTKNRVYLLGGFNGTATVSTVYTAPINTDGTLGAWGSGTALPGILSLSQTVVTKNRVYLLGGFNGTATVSTVYTAPINTDGTLGAWGSGTALPDVLALSQAIATKNRVYLLGGANISGIYVSTVYSATFYGGENDYSPYYDGTILPLDINYESSLFALPDFTSKEKNGVNFYIKI